MADNAVRDKSFRFALAVVRLYRKLQEEREYVISRQLLRSGTSIGANVEEAISAQSRKDFISKMAIAAKEARETKYWLRLLAESELTELDVRSEAGQADELVRLLVSIVKTSSTPVP